jgi:hypothetical protein
MLQIASDKDRFFEVGGRTALAWILGRLAWGGWGWSGFTWLRIGTGGGGLSLTR